jgi:hypothetical protein
MVCSAQTMHLSCVKINTISKRTERVSTWASSPRSTIECIHNDFWAYGTLAQTVHLSCTYINVVSNRPKRDSTWPKSPRSSIGCIHNDLWAYSTFGAKPCTYLELSLSVSPNAPKLDSMWPTSPSSSIVCVSRIISEHVLRSAQTVHLCCTDTNTISKRTEMRLHMTHIISEFYRVRVKWFLSLWYVRRNPCTYLASRLSLSPIGMK